MTEVWDVHSAREAGIGRDRLSGRGFSRVTRGAYLPADRASDLRARCLAVRHVRPDTVVSHWSAVALLGLPLPPARRHEPLHVLVGPGSRPLRRDGVVAHRSDRDPPTLVGAGLRVTPPGRTWCDLARSGAEVVELVAVADAMCRRWPGLRADLERSVGVGVGRRGIRNARRALGLVDPRAESLMESWLRVVLVDAGLPAPELQLEVRDGRGVFVARVDLAWPDSRLVVEYDGDHHRDRATWVADLRRRERLESLGWSVVVVTADDVLRHPGALVRRVRDRL